MTPAHQLMSTCYRQIHQAVFNWLKLETTKRLLSLVNMVGMFRSSTLCKWAELQLLYRMMNGKSSQKSLIYALIIVLHDDMIHYALLFYRKKHFLLKDLIFFPFRNLIPCQIWINTLESLIFIGNKSYLWPDLTRF